MNDNIFSEDRDHIHEAGSDVKQACKEQTKITCIDASSLQSALNGNQEQESFFEKRNNEDSDHSYAAACKSLQACAETSRAENNISGYEDA